MLCLPILSVPQLFYSGGEMGSIHCEGTSVSQSYSNQIVQMVWYCKCKAHVSQKFTFGLAQDKPQGMAMHQDVQVHLLWYMGKTNTPPQTQCSPSVHVCVKTFHFGRDFIRKSAAMSSVGQ